MSELNVHYSGCHLKEMSDADPLDAGKHRGSRNNRQLGQQNHEIKPNMTPSAISIPSFRIHQRFFR